MEEFKTFLESYSVPKGDYYTHTTKSTGSLSNGWISGSYFVAKEYTEGFLTRYCNMIYKGSVCTLTERPGPFGPLRVDFDFKSSLDKVGSKRQYDEKIIKKIVKFYQDEIRNISDPECFNEDMLWCIVLEKEKPRVIEGNLKDGFHLHFPYFVCDNWTQDHYLRDKVTDKMQVENIWKGKSFKVPISDFIDRDIAKKPWMMYGSMNYKNNKSTPYIYNRWEKVPENKRYGHVYDDKLNEISMHSVFELSMEGRKNPVKYYLPRFLSIRNYAESSVLKETYVKKIPNINSKKIKRKPILKKRNIELVLEDIKCIKDGDIMSMISDDRSDNYQQWRYVGWVLFNIGQGHEEALNLWIEFSRRSCKFIDGECEDVWATFEMKDKSISSLLYLAKQDSPVEYNKWRQTNVRNLLLSSLNEPKPTEFDVSLIVSKFFGDKFVCSDVKKNEWYYFEDHRWREGGCIELRKIFVNKVRIVYCDLLNEINDEIKNIEYNFGMLTKDSDETIDLKCSLKKAEMKKKSCQNIISCLKSTQFHKRLLEMCQIEMYDPLFNKKKDENKNLLGCENGVIDLENLVFRDGVPDDYITMATGRYYREYNINDQEQKDLEENLRKIYTNDNIRNYFIEFFARGMKGGNGGKDWLIGMGPSDGAKSSMFSLIELTFGSGRFGYTGKFPRENFVQSTGRTSSSGPRPELARVRGKRFMGGQEISSNEKINLGFVKEMTGNDSFFARTLQEKGDEIKPQFTLITQLNVLPEIPGDDEAFWSRIRILDHNSKFVIPSKLCKNACNCGKEDCIYNVPDSIEEQFKKKRFHADEDFKDKMPELADALLWRFFEKYKELAIHKRKVQRPKEVLASTNMHRSKNDVFKRYIEDRMVKETNPEKAKTTYITHTEVNTDFIEWYKLEYPNYRTRIGSSSLKTELARRIGKIEDPKIDIYGIDKRGTRWKGYKFFDDEDNNQEIEISFLGK